MANTLKIVRLVTLITVSLFGLIAMGMGGALMPYFFLNIPAGIAIASGVFTLLTVPAMLIIEALKPNAIFTSTVIFEVIWLSFLSIMWLATGGVTAPFNFGLGCLSTNDDGFFGSSDDDIFGNDSRADSALDALCALPRALTAFGFLNWIFLFFYVIAIMVLSCVASSRKQGRGKSWTGSVATLMEIPGEGAVGVGKPEFGMNSGNSSYVMSSLPPQQQQQHQYGVAAAPHPHGGAGYA